MNGHVCLSPQAKGFIFGYTSAMIGAALGYYFAPQIPWFQ